MNNRHAVVAMVVLTGLLAAFGISEFAVAGQSPGVNTELLQRLNQLEYRMAALERRPAVAAQNGGPNTELLQTIESAGVPYGRAGKAADKSSAPQGDHKAHYGGRRTDICR